MRRLRLKSRRGRQPGILLLLALLLLRAYAPAGFMPGASNPLELQLCPAGMPAGMQAHMHMHMHMAMQAHTPAPADGHVHDAAHGDDCPFGHAPVAGPLGAGLAHESAPQVPLWADHAGDTPRQAQRLARAHQARAPPSVS